MTSDRLKRVIAFLRDAFPDDGADGTEGESVHLLCREAERLSALVNTPQLKDFASAVVLEAVHQRERWGVEHDAGKAPSDWFWLLGYLGGKALTAHIAGNRDKALHHTISSAAALANWHAAISGDSTLMRPGISTPKS